MANPSATPFPITGESWIDVMTAGYYWDAGTENTIYWSASDNSYEELFWLDPFGETGAITSLEKAFDYLSYYLDVEFVYVGYFDNHEDAYYSGSDINVSMSSEIFSSDNILAYGFFPDASYNESMYLGAPGDIFLNLNSPANDYSYEPGSAGWALLLHELGHVLGLKHPHDDGGTGRPTFDDIGYDNLDVDWASVMSYEDDYLYHENSFNPKTPMGIDVIALQYLYGANMNTNPGDGNFDIYTTNSYETLWTSGGTDGVDARTANQGFEIWLPYDIGLSTPIGEAIPVNEVELESPFTVFWLVGEIVDAIGSDFNDNLYGNYLNNRIFGVGGDDYIDGGDGIDIAYFNGNANESTLYIGDVSNFIDSVDGYDEIINIERLNFDNGYFAIDHDGNGGQAYRLYQAAFDRTPDPAGVGFWLSKIDNGMSLQEVGARFIDSDEFRLLYGSDPTDFEFLEALYSNVLDRAPDGDGFDWWLGQLESNPDKSRGKVLADFSESPENVANVYDDIAYGFNYDLWIA